MPIIVKRLRPGNDLRRELANLSRDKGVVAGVVLSLVGSLREACLRFADQEQPTMVYGPLEIVSATGTISTAGLHVHISVADKEGRTIGGHLAEGSIVFTTCEVVILDISSEWKFEKEFDEATGSFELREIENLDY